MELYLQAIAAVLLAVIIYLVVNSYNKELALLLTLAACCIVLSIAGSYIQPLIEFLDDLQQIGRLENTYLSILFKVVGISFLAEVASMVCADAGNATLSKSLQMLAACVILWLSIPLLSGLIQLIQDILGGI